MSASEIIREEALPEYVNIDGWFDIVLTAHKFNQGQDSDSKVEVELLDDEIEANGEKLRLVKFGGSIIQAGRMGEYWKYLEEYQTSRDVRLNLLQT